MPKKKIIIDWDGDGQPLVTTTYVVYRSEREPVRYRGDLEFEQGAILENTAWTDCDHMSADEVIHAIEQTLLIWNHHITEAITQTERVHKEVIDRLSHRKRGPLDFAGSHEDMEIALQLQQDNFALENLRLVYSHVVNVLTWRLAYARRLIEGHDETG